MAVRRVFLIWTHPLFHDSARLLLKHPDVIWVGAATDFATAHEAILKLQPDTVLFEKTGDGTPVDVMQIMAADTRGVRIIGLSLDDNEMSLYQRKRQAVVEAGDVLAFVLG